MKLSQVYRQKTSLYPLLFLFFTAPVQSESTSDRHDKVDLVASLLSAAATKNTDLVFPFKRTKRWTSNDAEQQAPPVSITSEYGQRQQSIPAANPNFEAAFQGECGKNNNSNPCEHICLDLHDGTYECSCFYGFTLAVDGYSCATMSTQASLILQPPATPSRQADATQQEFDRVGDGTTAANLATPAPISVSQHEVALGREELSTRPTGTLIRRQQQPQTLQQAPRQEPMKQLERANDNRKLVDELARGAKLKGNEIGQAGGNEHQEEVKVTTKRRLQRRLPENAAAWIHKVAAEASGSPSSTSTSTTSTTNASVASSPSTNSNPPNSLSAYLDRQLGNDELEEEEGFEEEPEELDGLEELGENENKGSPLETVLDESSNVSEEANANTLAAQPQMTTTITRNSVQDSGSYINNGKANSGGQQENNRPLAQEQQQRTGAANANNCLVSPAAGQVIELHDGYEDLDLDIRSIMVSNDKLVKRLANYIMAKPELEGEPLDGRPAIGRHNDAAARAGRRLSRPRQLEQRQRLDYDLRLLGELVRKTIEDHAQRPGGLRLDTVGAGLERAAARHRSVNENGRALVPEREWPAQGSSNETSAAASVRRENGEHTWIKPNQSSTNRTRRSNGAASGGARQLHNGQSSSATAATARSTDSINMVRFELLAQARDNARLCNSKRANEESGGGGGINASTPNRRRFKDCNELPECESGGQCIVESHWVSSEASDFARMEPRARCRCPIGRGGHLCQKPIQRSVPKFMGHSYLALPMIKEPTLASLRFVFKPEPKLGFVDTQTSLLLYSQKFLLLLDDMGRIELRYLTFNEANNNKVLRPGTRITRVIGSRDVDLNKWNELIITDASNDNQTNNLGKALPGVSRVLLVVPDTIRLAGEPDSSELFVAGLPEALQARNKSRENEQNDLGWQSMLDDRSVSGFLGCVGDLVINGRQYNFKSDLNGDSLDGFDIAECCE